MSQSSHQDKRLNKRLKDMPVAIVGMASIFANSRYLNKFWDLISEKIDAIVDIPDSHWNADDYYDADKSAPDKSYCKRGGFLPEVDFNPMEFGLPPNILELTDTSQLLSLVVAKEVLADAGVDAQYDTDRIGITLGVGGGQKINHSLSSRLQYPVLKKVFKNSGISDADSEMLIKKFQDQYIHWEENSFPGSLGNVIAGRIANRFDLGGMNCVVDAACAGSLAAMRMAITELVEGRSDMMITGGVCTDNSPSMYMSFSKTPAFTTNDTIQPFDIDSKGMMIGEGIGMIAIKRLDDAERDGDKIYAVIKGIGSSSDGKFKSIYAPRPEGQAKALKRAYDDAGFAPHTVGLIEAHGTGTAAGDVAEFNGLKSVFAEDNDAQQHIALGSVKSQVGHTKSTAGTAGVIKVALALHHKVLPPTINVSKPHPKLGISDSPFYLNTETRPWLPRPDDTPRRAGISSFGFGGTNFHIVLEEYRQDHARNDKYRQRTVPQSLLISADNKAELQGKLTQLQTEVNAIDISQANAQELALQKLGQRFAIAQVAPTSARLGLVVTSIADLTVQLTQALNQLTNNDADNWQLPSGASYRSASLGDNNTAPKVAALFAGQGAQYVNMATELACFYPEMRQQLMQADKVFAQHKQTPLSQIMYPIPAFEAQDIAAQQAALTNTAYAQSAIGAVSMGQYALFTQAGFSPDMVAGHSFGELSALCAAGVISQADYYQLAFARGQAMAATPADQDPGAMYAIIVPPQATEQGVNQLESCISAFDGVKVANYNAPTQLVIAGPTEACAEAAKAVTAELGFKAIALPVSGAFHTPLVGHAQQPFAKAISKVKFAKPKVALFANGTGKLYPSNGKAIQTAFSEHMLQSVRFSEQLVAMYDAGARVFVEFGPKNILQKLVEATLGNKPETVSVVSLNPNPKGSSDTQLRQAAIQLAVLGLPLSEVDPYQAPIAELANVSPMNVKLTAQNYISPATQSKMQKSLQQGLVTSKTVEVPVEKIVEKIVEKQVIKTEYVEVASTPAASAQAPVAQATTAQPAHASQTSAQANNAVSNDSLSAFFAAQQQAAMLHQQFLAIPQQYGDTFNSLMTAQAQMASSGVAIPESLQRSMELFHQHQAQTLQSHTQFLTLQAQTSQAALAMLQGQASATPATTLTNTLAAQQMVAAPQTPVMTQAAPATVTPAPTPAPVVPEPIAQVAQPTAVSSASTGLSAETVQLTMMTVVADKTGYPTEMLELSMDMEADLGIDSIKRVEILGTVQDELPGLPELSPEDLAECRTLGEIVDYMQSTLSASTASAAPVTAPVQASNQTSAPTSLPTSGLSAQTVLNTMMTVVADKTGYPAEMLELTMDMEADLGIDSIKRVEILGTVQDELPGLPELSPEDLAECRTLGEIVSYMQGQLGMPAASITTAPTPPPVDTSALPPHSGVALKKLPAADKLEACYSTDSCIVITDDGHNAGVLAEKLHAKGLTVAVIRNPDTISVAHSPLSSDISSYTLSSIDDAEIAKVIKAITATHPIAGFVHLQPQFNANSKDLVSCNVAAKAAVDNAFLWAKHLHAEFSKPLQSRLSYVTVSRIDGGFGYLNSAALSKAELNQAALSGLTKTLSHEWPNVFCRALDIANDIDAKTFANAIIAELFDVNAAAPNAKRLTEVGISPQGRATLVAVKTDTSHYPAAVLTQQDTLLVTGGAKGVTFECALTLAKQCQSHFVLAGRSQHLGKDMPAWAQGKQASELKAAAISYIQSQGEKPTPKQIDALVWPVQSSLEIDRALSAFTEVGASAQYVAMDVSNPDAVKAALAALTDTNGKNRVINGVIHGAGVLADKHIQDKTLDELNRVYSTKVTGVASIINALDPQHIKLVAMFSSAAGFYGNTGQSDYAMSNEILNKTALKLAAQLPQAKVMSFNWGPWGGGMVSSALKKMFVERGVYVIPLQAGANLFAHSLLSPQSVQMLIGSDMQGSATQDTTAKKPNANTLPHAEGSLTFSAPYLAADTQTVTVTRVLQPNELVFVNDHRIAGNPVLPTVCAIQWMRETAQTLCHVPVSIADYKLLKGIIFDTDQAHLLQLQLTQTGAGLNALISSRALNEPDAAMKPQYQATLVVNDALTPTAVAQSSLPATVLQKLAQVPAIHAGNTLYQNGTLFHGPRLQGIKQVLSFDDEQLVCQVKLAQINPNDCPGFAPSAVSGGSQIFAEDLLLQAMLVWARLKYDAASLPSSMGQFITVAPFASGDQGYIQLEVIKHSGRMLVANVSLYHQDGRLSCQMREAKITISKTLNQAFINQHENQHENEHENLPANQHSKDSV